MHGNGQTNSSAIKLESGRLKETKINICSYEMYEMELLDRALISLQRTEEAYVDINNRIIDNVNNRKDRLNNINGRILGISQKILQLYGVKQAMRIVSPAHFPDIQQANNLQNHPHQSMFFDRVEGEVEKPNDLPELSSLKLRKLFNNRLQNEPENLKKLVSGVTKDINDISNLLLSFQRYRSTISDFKQGLQTKQQQPQNMPGGTLEQSEGLLGRVPENTESIAELMLFDSDINVYGDANIYIPEFDFKTRSTKQVSKARRNQRDQNARQILVRKKIEAQQRNAYQNLQEAPISVMKKAGDEGMMIKQAVESIGYTPIQKVAPKYVFKETLDGLGTVTDITEYDKEIKELEQRKIQKQQSMMQSQTANQLDQSQIYNQTMGGSTQQHNYQHQYSRNQFEDQSNVDNTFISEHELAPAAKRAMEKAEYARRRQEEEEIKRAIDEQAMQDQANGIGNNMDMYDEKGKTIPVEELIKQGFNKKLKQISTTMSRTMQMDQYNQPVINLQTVMDTNAQTQLNYRQRGDTMMSTQQRPPMQQQQQQNTQQQQQQQPPNQQPPPQIQQQQQKPSNIPPPPSNIPPPPGGGPIVSKNVPPPPPPPPLLMGGKPGIVSTGIPPPPPPPPNMGAGGQMPPPMQMPPPLPKILPPPSNIPPPPSNIPPPPSNIPPPPTINIMAQQKRNDPPSPINNRDNIPDRNDLGNDDSIIFDDFVEHTSFMTSNNQGQGPIFQESSFMNDMNKSSFLKPPGQMQPPPMNTLQPPQMNLGPSNQQQMMNQSMLNQSQMNQTTTSVRQPPPLPQLSNPAPKVLSFSEQIALASQNLQKKGTTTIVPKPNANNTSMKKEEGKGQPPQFQRRMSHMDALKEQIMLRQRALNPDKKKDEELGEVKKPAFASRWDQIDSADEMEEESENEYDTD